MQYKQRNKYNKKYFLPRENYFSTLCIKSTQELNNKAHPYMYRGTQSSL